MSGMSVATIKAPEFINITSVSPLISKCEIKVLYVGENRNRSYITKEVATQIAQTLPGVPIVGQYIDKKEDFGDHGQQMIIDGEGIKFNTLTKPYGFVAPDTKVWFQEFEDTDEFGNTVVREYLMTEGYLWTEQFEECKRVITDGNPQSMELDEKTLKGHWSTDNNKGIEFFVINDAIFSKLCILGEDVEPCFEGASVTSPEVSSQFSKDEGFVRTLFSMMQELKTALEGEHDMENENLIVEETPVISEDKVDEVIVEETQEVIEEVSEVETPVVEEEAPVIEEPVAEAPAAETEFTAEVSEEAEVVEPVVETEAPAAEESVETEFVKNEDEKDEKAEEDSEESEESDEEDDEDKKKYALLEQKYAELETKFAALNEEYQALVEFKNSVDTEKKDALIESFYMLDDEDKADVVSNKATYSLEEIEAKLSVAYTRKQMAAEKVEAEAAQEEAVGAMTYTLEDTMDTLPDWVKAVRDIEKSMN